MDLVFLITAPFILVTSLLFWVQCFSIMAAIILVLIDTVKDKTIINGKYCLMAKKILRFSPAGLILTYIITKSRELDL